MEDKKPEVSANVSEGRTASEGSADDLELSDGLKSIKQGDVSVDKIKEALNITELQTDKVANKEGVVPVENKADDLDTIISDIVNEATLLGDSEKKPLSEKTDRPEYNKVKELERKNAELLKVVDELKQPRIEPYSPEFYQELSEESGIEVDELRKFVTLQEKGFQKGIKPIIEALVSKVSSLEEHISESKLSSSVEKDKLFKLIKKDFEDILQNDPAIKELPIPDRIRVAKALAKEKNENKIFEVAKKLKTSTMRVIPSDGSTVSTPVAKKSSKLNDADANYLRMLGFNSRQLENFGNTQKSFIEE
jgi:hypothetical protein